VSRQKDFGNGYMPFVTEKMIALSWDDTNYTTEMNQLKTASKAIIDKLCAKGVIIK